MGLTVSTPTQKPLLTTVQKAKDEIGITTATNDALLLTFIRQAGDMAATYCNRTFPRQVYSETAPAYGGPYFSTRQAPVVTLSSVSYLGDVLTDVSIHDGELGLLYRQGGFDWTAQRWGRAGLGSGLFLDHGIPVPLTEEPSFTVAYTAGWITPEEDLCAVKTISVVASDDSFNDSSSGFPALLKAGDIIETSGFSTAANNGRFVVTGTPTTAKIAVDADLTDESAGQVVNMTVSNLPGDVVRAIHEIIKTLYAQRATDSTLIEKQAGPMRIRYSEGRASGGVGLAPTAAALLKYYKRTRQ